MIRLAPVVKNLLLINGLMFLALMVAQAQHHDLNSTLGLYYPQSSAFKPVQIVTHMFMHGGFLHILMNMFALWMFGNALEMRWGPQRFLTYYLVCGLGAAALHMGVIHFQVMQLSAQIGPGEARTVFEQGWELLQGGRNYADQPLGQLNRLANTPTVGASGAVFGLLLGFGMLYPNVPLMLIFFPVPIKAKYFVMGYAAVELFSGVTRIQGDNIAHFAHLGGMLFGYLLIRFWQIRPGRPI
ncbi:MAG: rhomboid family intramembrane serine protease [Bacteroidetes bacterium]|nr:rhomboid family intramembrane serine protease [Bacteroidota bacterium]